ncbi:MAG: TolC family protein [Pirellulaceae bacterium]
MVRSLLCANAPFGARRLRVRSCAALLALCAVLSAPGCAHRPHLQSSGLPDPSPDASTGGVEPAAQAPLSPNSFDVVRPVTWRQAEDRGVERIPADAEAAQPRLEPALRLAVPFDNVSPQSVEELVLLAEAQNPRLIALRREADAAQAKTGYADKLPDPTIGANVFAAPIETAAGAQTANMTVMQKIPWLGRLDAKTRQMWFESLAVIQVYQAERLKVAADVRAAWYRLYVLQRQVEVNEALQSLLEPLIRVANGRVAAGRASQGDVLLGTLQLSRLSEQLLTLRQQLASDKAELNRLLGRPAEFPISVASRIDVALPDWSHEQLRQLAIEQQPDIAAAALRVQASRWGMEVARLERRPEVSIGASWYAINDNRPAANIVDVGRDAWSVGMQVSVPLWRQKYDAMEREAASRHLATHATVEDVVNRYDALLRDLWEQARAASETSQLYRSTILPQAEQTLKADQESYSTGAVEFDRVMRDLQNVLTLRLEYHRAEGRLAIALARIRQAVGVDLASPSSGPERLPAPDP